MIDWICRIFGALGVIIAGYHVNRSLRFAPDVKAHIGILREAERRALMATTSIATMANVFYGGSPQASQTSTGRERWVCLPGLNLKYEFNTSNTMIFAVKERKPVIKDTNMWIEHIDYSGIVLKMNEDVLRIRQDADTNRAYGEGLSVSTPTPQWVTTTDATTTTISMPLTTSGDNLHFRHYVRRGGAP